MTTGERNVTKQSRVIINVGGMYYETFEETLQRYPDTLLGNPKKRRNFYCPKRQQYFFNRSRISFDAILFFYQSSGKLYCPPEIKLRTFEEECKFFDISHENIIAMKDKEGALLNEIIKAKLKPQMSDTRSLRIKIWEFLEYPSSSTLARCFATFSLILISLSIITNLMETYDDRFAVSRPWLVVEFFLNSWFFVELFFRLITAPEKAKFFRNPMNWIDIIVIVPYFVAFFIFQTNVYSPRTLRMVRILRVLRMFRTTKHSQRMKAIAFIVKDSLKDLQLFFVCLLIVVTFGAGVMFHTEQSDPTTQFTSVPQSMWWAVQTFLTLGYGDTVPTTIIGKLFSSAFMVLGVSTICLPVLSLIVKFTAYYSLEL